MLSHPWRTTLFISLLDDRLTHTFPAPQLLMRMSACLRHSTNLFQFLLTFYFSMFVGDRFFPLYVIDVIFFSVLCFDYWLFWQQQQQNDEQIYQLHSLGYTIVAIRDKKKYLIWIAFIHRRRRHHHQWCGWCSQMAVHKLPKLHYIYVHDILMTTQYWIQHADDRRRPTTDDGVSIWAHVTITASPHRNSEKKVFFLFYFCSVRLLSSLCKDSLIHLIIASNIRRVNITWWWTNKKDKHNNNPAEGRLQEECTARRHHTHTQEKIGKKLSHHTQKHFY